MQKNFVVMHLKLVKVVNSFNLDPEEMSESIVILL